MQLNVWYTAMFFASLVLLATNFTLLTRLSMLVHAALVMRFHQRQLLPPGTIYKK